MDAGPLPSTPGYRPSPWPFLVAFIVPVAVLAGAWLGGVGTFLPLGVVFVCIPLLDLALGRDVRNPDEADVPALVQRRAFRWITFAWVPTQVALVAFVLGRVGAGVPPIEWAGLALSTGITTGGVGITIAHELGHRRGRFERLLSNLLLVTVGYGHWGIEHVLGHHLHVATPLDPATARMGQSFYRFWPQTVAGTLRGAWSIETARLGRVGRARFSPSNRVLSLFAVQAGLVLGVGLLLGASAMVFVVVQGVIAFTLLEAVNYIEHYGLERRLRPDGKYERVSPVHSWNASERLTNWFLVNLQRHSDHHAAPARRYQALRHFDASPQLPTGYAGMVLLALVPPLWFRVMDRRVAAYRG